ncbi:MAG: hypothetical protein AB1646_06985 [Thermodesulfobacteriota bacterium]
MSFSPRFVLVALLIVVVVAGNALAVGYERCTARSSRTLPSATEKVKDSAAVWKVLNEAFMIGKVPGWLDRTAAAVKDIAGQFGLGRQGSR